MVAGVDAARRSVGRYLRHLIVDIPQRKAHIFWMDRVYPVHRTFSIFSAICHPLILTSLMLRPDRLYSHCPKRPRRTIRHDHTRVQTTVPCPRLPLLWQCCHRRCAGDHLLCCAEIWQKIDVVVHPCVFPHWRPECELHARPRREYRDKHPGR
jgi:hypothetical protein